MNLIVIVISFYIILMACSLISNKRGEIDIENQVNAFLESIKPEIEKCYTKLLSEVKSRYPLIKFQVYNINKVNEDLRKIINKKLIDNSPLELNTIKQDYLQEIANCLVCDFKNDKKEIVADKLTGSLWEAISSDFWITERYMMVTEEIDYPGDWHLRREIVYKRDQGKCKRCGVSLNLDEYYAYHLIPRTHGGTHTLDNLVTLCESCNSIMYDNECWQETHCVTEPVIIELAIEYFLQDKIKEILEDH